MVQIDFDLATEGAALEDAFLTPYELELMFEQTRQDLGAGLQRKLAGVRCAEHDAEPRITIRGRYDQETEEMAIDYTIDTCCKAFLVRVVALINRTA